MTSWVKRLLSGYIGMACLLAVVWALAPHAKIFADSAGPSLVRAIFDVGMFAPLATGAVYAFLAARNLEAGNPSRPAWLLLTGWLSSFAIGEALLIAKLFVSGSEAVSPSPGDICFMTGYACLVAGTFLFARVYATSGLPIAKPGELAMIAGLASVILAAAAFALLLPLWTVSRPFGEKATLIGFPILDLVVLVPTAVLCRITFHFRGGAIWRVWACIGVGFLVLAGADTLCAYQEFAGMDSLSPLIYIAFMTGYLLTALAAMRQYALSKKD